MLLTDKLVDILLAGVKRWLTRVRQQNWCPGGFWKIYKTKQRQCVSSWVGDGLTPQVLDEVLELHLPLRLHVGAVHVRVEEDDGESQDEDGVRVLELPDQHRVTDTVPLTGERGRESKRTRERGDESPFLHCITVGIQIHDAARYLKASTSLSTRCASPCTLIWAWNFLRASSRSIPEKSISSRTQLETQKKKYIYICIVTLATLFS